MQERLLAPRADEASSFLTTFNTELGRFSYTVIPFGVTVVRDVFQCKLDQCFGHLKKVILIADDIMSVAKKPNHSNHGQALKTLLLTAGKCNVQLNCRKLQCKRQEVDFIHETYTTRDCKPDKNKIIAITKIHGHTDEKQVQSFIGMTNYLSKFSARLSEIAEAIRELAKDKVPFNLDQAQQSAFTQMKQEIVNASILVYYNTKKQTVLQTDASTKGLGTCLLQEEKPVHFVSKALTDVQWEYVVIVIESLAVAWAKEKYNHFLYASQFILDTSQKPQEAILSKYINEATPRIQRILRRTFPYHSTV